MTSMGENVHLTHTSDPMLNFVVGQVVMSEEPHS